MFVDLPLEELRAYRPDIREPANFDAFWHRQFAAARDTDAAAATFTPVGSALRTVDVLDVDFPGYAGDRVRGWLLVPREPAPDAPVVVEYVGYNGGRGDPLEWLRWSAVGSPHFVMDSRGQGGGWRTADTPDPHDLGEPSTNGFMTRGVGSPDRYYFTRLYVDAVRAVDAVLTHPGATGRAVVTTGASQGGALTIVAAAWHDAVAAAMPDVAFLSHPRRAVDITDSRPFGELNDYCNLRPGGVDTVFDTLSYVDVANHAARGRVPALFSVALHDDIAPPSTVFAAYNRWVGPKDIAVYPFADHAGGGVTHLHRQLDLVRDLAAPGTA